MSSSDANTTTVNSQLRNDSIFGKQPLNGANAAHGADHGYQNIKIPEIKDTVVYQKSGFGQKQGEKVREAEIDGKFSFLEFGKNIVKGAGQFFYDIYENVVNKPIISLGMLVLGAAVASTPLGLTLLAGAGLMMSLVGAIFIGGFSAYYAASKEWDKLEEQGKEIGKLIPATIISAIGAVKASKMLSQATTGSAATTEKLSTSMKKTMNYFNQSSWEVIKNAVLTPYRMAKLIWANPRQFFTKDIKQTHKLFTGGISEKHISTNYGNKGYLKFRNLKNDYERSVNLNINPKLFTSKEKDYMLTVLNRKDPDRAKFIDWKFRGLLDASSLPTIIKQAGE